MTLLRAKKLSKVPGARFEFRRNFSGKDPWTFGRAARMKTARRGPKSFVFNKHGGSFFVAAPVRQNRALSSIAW